MRLEYRVYIYIHIAADGGRSTFERWWTQTNLTRKTRFPLYFGIRANEPSVLKQHHEFLRFYLELLCLLERTTIFFFFRRMFPLKIDFVESCVISFTK